MGMCQEREKSAIERANEDRSKILEKFNKKVIKEHASEIKLLLLGTGDSGKSTFLKQMKVSQMNGFSRNETLTYMIALQNNTLRSMKKLIQIASEHGTTFSSRTMKYIAVVEDANDDLTEEVAVAINKIWSDDDFPEFYRQVSHFAQVPSCTPYYFENAPRFSGDFKPTVDDIIRAKLKTTGIFETCFEFSDHKFRVVDVGGQRAERRKWLHCFTDVRAVIFLTAIDEYNMVLEEDGTTNRMEESLSLFEDVTGSRWLNNSSVVLFLNKMDLFKEKLQYYPLSDYFDDVDAQDGTDDEYCLEYIKNKFKDHYTGNVAGRLYTFDTCALDADKCKKVFAAVTDLVLQSAFEQIGIGMA